MTVTVRTPLDEATLDDEEIQAVLRAHIEECTGRKVQGEITIQAKPISLMMCPRHEHYRIVATLQPESKP